MGEANLQQHRQSPTPFTAQGSATPFLPRSMLYWTQQHANVLRSSPPSTGLPSMPSGSATLPKPLPHAMHEHGASFEGGKAADA